MNIRLPRLPILPSLAIASFVCATAEAHATLLTYWNFNNTSPLYQSSGGILGSFKTSAASPTDFGEIYSQTNNATPGTLSSNTSNDTVFNGAGIIIDFSNIGTIAGLPNGPTINGKKGSGTTPYSTQESTTGYAGYGAFAGSTVNAVGSDSAGNSLIFLNGANSLNNKYITLTLSSAGYEALSLSYSTRLSSAMTSGSEIWSYSTDGNTFNALDTINPIRDAAFHTETLDLSSLSSSALDNQSTFYLRMTFNSSSGNGSYSFDNIQLTGTAITTMIPESSTFALVGGLAVLGMAFTKRRRG